MVEMMRAAPGVPMVANAFPSLITMVGAMVVRIRFPGAMAFGPLEEKFFISLLRMMPVPWMTTFAPKDSAIVCVNATISVSYTHLRAHETRHDLVCRLLLEK